MDKRCRKKEGRTLFEILDVFDCSDCKYLNNDYYFYIGKYKIYVYYLKECSLDDSDLLFDLKVLYLLQRAVKEEIILLWFETYNDFEKLFDILDIINKDIIIVIEK